MDHTLQTRNIDCYEDGMPKIADCAADTANKEVSSTKK